MCFLRQDNRHTVMDEGDVVGGGAGEDGEDGLALFQTVDPGHIHGGGNLRGGWHT